MNENTPVIIGRYRLSKTLGIGAFGKVKCERRVVRLLARVFFYVERRAYRRRNMTLLSSDGDGRWLPSWRRCASL